jgi:Ulp1 family protease
MPYKNPEKQREAVKKAMQKKRALDKQKKEELEAEREYIKPVSEKYPISWERYKEIWGENVSFQDYLEDKRKFEQENKGEILDPDIEQILDRHNYPIVNQDCKRFRLMITGMVNKDPFFINDHHLTCESCIAWYHNWKWLNRGANPWG